MQNFKSELLSIRSQAVLLIENQEYEKFDMLFSRLKILLQQNTSIVDLVIADPEIRLAQYDLQRCVSSFFYAYEKAWSIYISESVSPKKTFKIYPGYDGYKELTSLELRRATPRKVQKVLFVGSGPVPTTPIFLAFQKISVDCVDISREACELATRLTNKLGLHKYMRFLETDILDYGEFQQYDLVWVAVMAGETDTQKKTVVKHLCAHLRNKQILIMRTGIGVGRFIYASIEPQLFDGLLVSRGKPFSDHLATYTVRNKKIYAK